MPRRLAVIALVSLLLVGANLDGQARRSAPSITLAITGQALIKIDPRKHWANPYKGVRPILRRADVGFTNFEMAIDEGCGVPVGYQTVLGQPPIEKDAPGNTNGPHSVRPDVMDFLASSNLRLQSLANNHAWDLGDCGVLATIAAARKYGVTHAGTGTNLEEASGAAFIDVKGVRIGLIAATTSRDERHLIAPTASSPGVNGVWIGRQDDWDRSVAAVKAAAARADFVIYYQHFQITGKEIADDPTVGHIDPGDVMEWQTSFARAMIDAGAALYIAHGDRIFDGVEIYKGRPILRQFGGLAYQGLRAPGSYDPLVWEGLLGLLTIRDGRVRSLEVLPLKLDEGRLTEYGGEVPFREKRGFADLATGTAATKIVERFAELSRPYGTKVTVTEARAYVEIEPGKVP